jgi:hypothetical protein
MKTKLLLLVTLVLLTSSVLFAELMQPVNSMKAVDDGTIRNLPERNTRTVPDFNFDVAPLNIITTYYDYFPGGYESIPIRVQPSPAGAFPGGGVYIAFQATPAAGGVRRVYYSYIEGDAVTNTSYIDLTATSAEGFPGIDIDQETGVPFVSWHTLNPDVPGIYHLPITFDQYNLIGVPGLWNAPYTVVDNPYTINGIDGQEFIWPAVFVGPSRHAGLRRIYVIGKNYTSNPSDYACENSLIAYADFSDPTDLATFNSSDWTYLTVPQLDAWRAQDVRPFRATIVSRETGKIAIVGHKVEIGEDLPAYGPHDHLFVLENDNYGDGEWTLFIGENTIPVENPINPATGEGYFHPGDEFPMEDLRYGPYVNRHNTVVDELGNYHFVANYTLSTEENTWYPYMTTAKHVKFDRATEEFVVNDLHPRNDDGSFYLPWGDPPVFENGNLVTNASFPYYWWSTDTPEAAVFHENYYRIMTQGSAVVALFQESVKARLFNDGGDDNYAAWADVPETYIMISGDYGDTWSDPIILNSIDTPELNGLIPTYWYIADHIEDLGDDWGKIHLFFLDQNDYGSSVQGAGPVSGGTLMYTSLNIDFSDYGGFVSVDESVTSAKPELLKQNYPNPFNPSTTIAYNLPEDSQVKVEVFNIKGQLIKTLANEFAPAGDNFVVWNGKDNYNRDVASGLYFYKLSTDRATEVKKMLLVK